MPFFLDPARYPMNLEGDAPEGIQTAFHTWTLTVSRCSATICIRLTYSFTSSDRVPFSVRTTRIPAVKYHVPHDEMLSPRRLARSAWCAPSSRLSCFLSRPPTNTTPISCAATNSVRANATLWLMRRQPPQPSHQ